MKIFFLTKITEFQINFGTSILGLTRLPECAAMTNLIFGLSTKNLSISQMKLAHGLLLPGRSTLGIEDISPTTMKTKAFFLKGKPIDPNDRCVICQKLLLSECHVFMPVYQYTPEPTKKKIWEWQESQEKACYFHFRSKTRCEFIQGRNPLRFNKSSSQFEETNTPSEVIKQKDIEVPDDY